MRIAAVLLRWYKSFNVNYMGYAADRRQGVSSRPWNLLSRSTDSEDDFPFIEIPLEEDITTVVGANESGKSHLLSAISKVLTGKGIPDGFGKDRMFSRTDLCHYMSQRSKNAEDWPNIGLQFTSLTSGELQAVRTAIGKDSFAKSIAPENSILTLVLAPDNTGTEAYLFSGNDSVTLKASELETLRKCLPTVDFIRSELAISDQVLILALIAAYGTGATAAKGVLGIPAFDFVAAQRIAQTVASLNLNKDNPSLPPDKLKKLAEDASELVKARLDEKGAELEVQLFRDVLGITADTLRFVANLDISDRTHADGLTTKWNREIDEKLNLAHYWTQDDSFALRVNYKQGLLYFEITDKTGATYTFRERSSGLRFFLSYYIQAKALESLSRTKGGIVLMDEPDCFLSILGQRNLLSVFESLVQAESSSQRLQLVYTTHSPFLINRNFPHRLRLVKKGDAEEGTQLVDQAMLRRYEPVRSALGIDCSQTLFMGATNLVVEGPADQYIICELVRFFAEPDNINELLDLNSVVVVSAESAPSVEKLLAASQWGDEAIPATVVLLDSDAAGENIKKRLIGQARNCKKLLDEMFVLQIGGLIQGTEQHKILTIEDLIPIGLYRRAVEQFVQKWHPDVPSEKQKALATGLHNETVGNNGLVAATKELFNAHVYSTPRDEYDKYGILLEVIALVHSSQDGEADVVQLKERMFSLCDGIRRAISASQQASRRRSGKQAIVRLIDDFFVGHKESSSVFDVQLLLERIQRDVVLLGEDGESLDAAIKRMLAELTRLRLAGHHHLRESDWGLWKRAIEEIRKNPLGFQVKIVEGKPEAGSSVTTAEKPDTADLPTPAPSPTPGASPA